ncbi:MAG: RHS repeat-associated core domain-containing protein [Pseudomonadales bacterium]
MQLVSHGTTTNAYDANGNRIKKTESGIDTHYLYNTEERLTQVEDHNHNTIATYYYDPFGLRLYKDVAGTRTHFLYNGEGLAAEYDAAGNLIAEYHYGPNKPWMTEPLFQRRNGNVYYYQTDHLGTPQKLITKSGQIVWQGQYEAFGKVTETINTIDNPLRFPGQYADGETGTYYNYFRDYDGEIGSYVSTDPLGLVGGQNRYVYVAQNPIVAIDQQGTNRALLVGACSVFFGAGTLRTIYDVVAKYNEQLDRLYYLREQLNKRIEACNDPRLFELVRNVQEQIVNIATRKAFDQSGLLTEGFIGAASCAFLAEAGRRAIAHGPY